MILRPLMPPSALIFLEIGGDRPADHAIGSGRAGIRHDVADLDLGVVVLIVPGLRGERRRRETGNSECEYQHRLTSVDFHDYLPRFDPRCMAAMLHQIQGTELTWLASCSSRRGASVEPSCLARSYQKRALSNVRRELPAELRQQVRIERGSKCQRGVHVAGFGRTLEHQTRRGEIAGRDEVLAAFEECRYFIAVQLPGNYTRCRRLVPGGAASRALPSRAAAPGRLSPILRCYARRRAHRCILAGPLRQLLVDSVFRGRAAPDARMR